MADTRIREEDLRKRADPEIRTSIILFRRVYNIARGATSLFPVRGDACDLEGVSGSGIRQPHVMSVSVKDSSQSGKKQFTVVFYQVRQYSGTPTGNGTELKGSRQESQNCYKRSAVSFYATTDGSTGLPSVGSFFTPISGVADSGDFGRTCVNVDQTPERLPGLYFHVAHYASYQPYS